MPLVIDEPQPSRRHLLVIANEKNQKGWGDISTGVRLEREQARHLFLDTLDYERSTYREIVNPRSRLKQDVLAWLKTIPKSGSDWLVVYYTGHGEDLAGELHLITSDIKKDEVPAAIGAHELAKVLVTANASFDHVLLILDTCASGTAQAQQYATSLRREMGGRARAAGFHAITSSRSIEPAHVGLFLRTLTEVLKDGKDSAPDAQYLSLDKVIGDVNLQLAKATECAGTEEQHAAYASSGETGTCFLPNPGWDPRLRAGTPRDQASAILYRLQSSTLRLHWLPRARGVSAEADAGMYFTGRSAAIQAISDWLKQQGSGRGLVVLGSPGSGKSTLLARLAVLADPRWRASALGAEKSNNKANANPLSAAIDVALFARQKNVKQLALEIGHTLGISFDTARPTEPEAVVVEELNKRENRTLLLVDALDEADAPTECAGLLRSLVEQCRGVCVLVGTRDVSKSKTSVFAALGNQFTPLNIDSDAYYAKDDIVRLVEHRLAVPGSPYAAAQDRNEIRKVAQAVANRAGHSFLVAATTARALASREQSLTSIRPEDLPTNIGEAFDLDLERFATHERRRLIFVLGALAFARGDGLPAALHYPVAATLAGNNLTKDDVLRCLELAGFYVSEDEEFGESVFRIYHGEFAAYLRDRVAKELSGADPPAIEARIASALESTVEFNTDHTSRSWTSASSYVLAYYPVHLRRAGRTQLLADLVCDARWIEAKRQRFKDFTPFLDDLTMVIEDATKAEPPHLTILLRCAATYSRFVTVAPPIVLDVLAAAGQTGRARLIVNNIESPLDRCHALCLLAQRYAEARQEKAASECLVEANLLAAATPLQYRSMAYFWIARAAVAAGRDSIASTLAQTMRESIEVMLATAQTRAEDGGKRTAALVIFGQRLGWWPPRLGVARSAGLASLDKEWGRPHWLFWTALTLRELKDAEGMETLRLALQATPRSGTEIDLQVAAVAGDTPYLSGFASSYPENNTDPVWKRRGNVALALAEAGMSDALDTLNAAGAFAVEQPAESLKLYAWSFAKQRRYMEAVSAASTIGDDEERARALYRIAETAVMNGADADSLHQIGAGAKLFHDELNRRAAAGAKNWRVKSWLASALLHAMLKDDALKLAEEVCRADLTGAEDLSTLLPVMETESAKTHRERQQKSEIKDEDALWTLPGSKERLLSRAAARRSARQRVTSFLARAKKETADPGKAYRLWLKALAESPLGGRGLVDRVLADVGDVLGDGAHAPSTAKMREEVAQLDIAFEAQAVEATRSAKP